MIPFLRLYPTGHVMEERISRGPLVERMAGRFMDNGGRYMICIRDSLEVELVAAMPVGPGQFEKLAEATCYNDPHLPMAIDQLVRDSINEMERRLALH